MNERLRRIFHNMKNRCYNPRVPNYKDYGARGITICDEWLNHETVKGETGHKFKGWIAFRNWALSNGYQDGLSIDRIDNSKGYSPDNCRWATRKQQNNNQRRNHLVKYKGETKNLTQWCKELGLDYDKTKARINNLHWTIKNAFESKDNHSLRLVTYKGRTQSLADWCRELNLTYYTVVSRINDSHWSIEKAFETKCNPKLKLITYKGKTQHLAEWCRELGVSYRVVQGRMNKLHWSFEKAIDGKPCGVEY